MYRELCIGREAERHAFREFLTRSEYTPGIDLCVIRGLGGIGKTTLSRAFAADFIEAYPSALAEAIDLVTLPERVDVASLLRAIGPDDTDLRAAAARLDQLAAVVRAAEPPADREPGTGESWAEVRNLAVEALTFFSSAAIETMSFGQPTSSASNAVVAGLQAAAAARAALGGVVAALLAEHRIDEGDAEIALDLERFVIEALARYLRATTGSASRGDRMLLILDKAENIADRLPRFVALLEAATLHAGARLSLICAGRLVRVRAVDGSELDMRQFLQVAAPNSVDIELAPLKSDEVRRLLRATRARLHGAEAKGEPPRWVVERVAAISMGLPLWVASLAEALFARGPAPWEDEAAFVHRLGADILDLPTTVELIFREARIDDQTSAFPLLVALALAPAHTPRTVICAAAGLSEESLNGFQNRYSFMRGSRLHDTARGVLRQLLATSDDVARTIEPIALHFQRWLAETAPPGSPLSLPADWRDHIRRSVEIRLWLGTEQGIHSLIDFALMGLPTAAPWIGPIFEDAAWFVDRRYVSQPTRRLLASCARAAFPLLLTHAFAADDPEASFIAAGVLEETQRARDFGPAIGRYLDEIDASLRRLGIDITGEARLALDSMRLHWLSDNGFDDEAYALTADIASRVEDIPNDAAVRTHIGRSMLRLLEGHLDWGEREEGALLDDRHARVDSLLRSLVHVSPRNAPRGVRLALKSYGERPPIIEAINALAPRRIDFPEDREFRAELGNALLDLGRFEEAERVFREGLALQPDWLGGTRGRARALLATNQFDSAANLLIDQLERLDRRSLTEAGVRQRSGLVSDAVLALVVADRAREASDVVPDIATSRYAQLLVALFGDDDWEAYRAVEALVQAGTSRDELAPEIAIALARSGRGADARAALDAWANSRRTAVLRRVESLLLEAARRRGWLSDVLTAGSPGRLLDQ